jgi:hypothetical protein
MMSPLSGTLSPPPPRTCGEGLNVFATEKRRKHAGKGLGLP